MKYILMFAIIVISLIGCKDDVSNSNNANVVQVSAEYIKTITVTDKSVTFLVVCSVGSPNYTFVRADEIRNDMDVSYKIYGFPDKGTYPALTYPMEAIIKFSTTTSGTYNYHFETLNSQKVDTVLVIQ